MPRINASVFILVLSAARGKYYQPRVLLAALIHRIQINASLMHIKPSKFLHVGRKAYYIKVAWDEFNTVEYMHV